MHATSSPFRTKLLTTTSGLILASLAFTGCGSNETDSSASSSASESSSASASVTESGTSTSESVSDKSSTKPSDSSSSDNSSDSAVSASGAYKAADKNGPAQNVPKPVKPEDMNVETPEAMEKFIHYWNDLRNYAIQTGDTSEIRKYTSTEYKTAIQNFDSWDQLYMQHGWIIGGSVDPIFSISDAQSLGDGFYAVPMNYQNQDAIVVLDGEYTAHKMSDDDGRGYALKVQFSDSGNWYVIQQAIVGS
ncbi:MAG: DUF6318 family protein [Rothia sp. (in: high G+C Gram-positive bacteria)]|nr:DUF6318 family protein [Rothia sp. (in: high G+C Gram-positive bacteria)]